MTKQKKTRRLSWQILGLAGISALNAAVLVNLLRVLAGAAAEYYCHSRELVLTQLQQSKLDDWISRASWIFAIGFFVVLFLILLADRLRYIRHITAGIQNLQNGPDVPEVPLEGNNELTALACAVNDLALAQRELQARQQALDGEKEQLVRALSHDIRTPLTSILAYAELLAGQEDRPEQSRQLMLIREKAEQIRQLTDILLSGTQRAPEHFEDIRLLMEQLAAEFTEELESGFQVEADITGCRGVGGTLDVQQLRRIFDNLRQNVSKYADPAVPVSLHIGMEQGALVIRQENACRQDPEEAGYGLGLSSIRRIAHSYGGRAITEKAHGCFRITVVLEKF